MGEMAAIAVVIAVLARLTLLPAALAVLGPHINALRSARLTRRSARTRAVGEMGE